MSCSRCNQLQKVTVYSNWQEKTELLLSNARKQQEIAALVGKLRAAGGAGQAERKNATLNAAVIQANAKMQTRITTMQNEYIQIRNERDALLYKLQALNEKVVQMRTERKTVQAILQRHMCVDLPSEEESFNELAELISFELSPLAKKSTKHRKEDQKIQEDPKKPARKETKKKGTEESSASISLDSQESQAELEPKKKREPDSLSSDSPESQTDFESEEDSAEPSPPPRFRPRRFSYTEPSLVRKLRKGDEHSFLT